jgi:hypothetical protein
MGICKKRGHAWVFVTEIDHIQTGVSPTSAGGQEASQLQ